MLPNYTLQSKGLLCAATGVFNLSIKYEHLQARPCGQKIENLNNLETFLHGFLTIANLTCPADAQVHTHCYNKLSSKADL